MSSTTTRSTDPLVWIDCEMTGLNPSTDTILSIACIITTATLEPLDPHGFTATITTPLSTLNSMSPWCLDHHTRSGLLTACSSPTTSIPSSTAAPNLLSYIKRHIPTPQTALLAGNSVHVDKLFLMREPWTPVIEYLHYRILDVSAIKEGVRRWCALEVVGGVPGKELRHEALSDVWESIGEARFYRDLFAGLRMNDNDRELIGGGGFEGRGGRVREGGSSERRWRAWIVDT